MTINLTERKQFTVLFSNSYTCTQLPTTDFPLGRPGHREEPWPQHPLLELFLTWHYRLQQRAISHPSCLLFCCHLIAVSAAEKAGQAADAISDEVSDTVAYTSVEVSVNSSKRWGKRRLENLLFKENKWRERSRMLLLLFFFHQHTSNLSRKAWASLLP